MSVDIHIKITNYHSFYTININFYLSRVFYTSTLFHAYSIFNFLQYITFPLFNFLSALFNYIYIYNFFLHFSLNFSHIFCFLSLPLLFSLSLFFLFSLSFVNLIRHFAYPFIHLHIIHIYTFS